MNELKTWIYHGVICFARTRSEARGKFKKIPGAKIPPGDGPVEIDVKDTPLSKFIKVVSEAK